MAKKSLFWSITVILGLIAAYLLTNTVILPVATKNPFPEPLSPKTEVKGDNNSKKTEKLENAAKKNDKTGKGAKKPESKIQNIEDTETTVANSKDDLTKYFDLKKSEYLLRNRYNLSSEDSIYLVLDLVNKVARLEMKGIPLHDCQIKQQWISNSIKMSRSDAFLRWISQPFVVKNVDATIERVQFLVKNAPKDTIEANKMETQPAPRRTEDVYIVMNFDRDLQLIIQQAEISEGEDLARIESIKKRLVKREIEKSVKSITTLNRDVVAPRIVITLSKTDAITIYRALPQKLKMVLKM